MKLCSECDQPIPVKRMIAKPDATMCVPCQSKNDVPTHAGSRAVQRALVEPSEKDGGAFQNPPELHHLVVRG